MADVLSSLDDVGQTLSEVDLTSITADDFRDDPAGAEDRRKSDRDTLNEALSGVEDMQGILDSLTGTKLVPVADLKSVRQKVDLSQEYLLAALKQLGDDTPAEKG